MSTTMAVYESEDGAYYNLSIVCRQFISAGIIVMSEYYTYHGIGDIVPWLPLLSNTHFRETIL